MRMKIVNDAPGRMGDLDAGIVRVNIATPRWSEGPRGHFGESWPKPGQQRVEMMAAHVPHRGERVVERARMGPLAILRIFDQKRRARVLGMRWVTDHSR